MILPPLVLINIPHYNPRIDHQLTVVNTNLSVEYCKEMIGQLYLVSWGCTKTRDTIRNAGEGRRIGMTSRFLPVLEMFRKKERRFRYD
jgi:hypothetical protein